jgi:hypothetical protein
VPNWGYLVVLVLVLLAIAVLGRLLVRLADDVADDPARTAAGRRTNVWLAAALSTRSDVAPGSAGETLAGPRNADRVAGVEPDPDPRDRR